MLKKLFLGSVVGLLFAVGAQAQTLKATVTYDVTAPWETPCSMFRATDCVKGWRIYEMVDGAGVALFDIPAPTQFVGTITATGEAPFTKTSATIGATTVGIDGAGAEVESKMTLRSVKVPPNAPEFTIEVVFKFANSTVGGG